MIQTTQQQPLLKKPSHHHPLKNNHHKKHNKEEIILGTVEETIMITSVKNMYLMDIDIGTYIGMMEV